MSQVVPAYETLPEWETVAKNIVQNNPDIFPGVQAVEFVKNIKCVVVTNKERGEDKNQLKDFVKIKGITNPVRLFSQCSYVVEMYKKDWERMDEIAREWLVLYTLRRIPVQSQSEGKVVAAEYQDDGLIVRTVGPDWLKKHNLPSLTAKNVQPVKWNALGGEQLADFALSTAAAASDIVSDAETA